MPQIFHRSTNTIARASAFGAVFILAAIIWTRVHDLPDFAYFNHSIHVKSVRPYARPPEGIAPGEPLSFATAMPMGGSALGPLVGSHPGRPTRIEGNPDHPTSQGFCNEV